MNSPTRSIFRKAYANRVRCIHRSKTYRHLAASDKGDRSRYCSGPDIAYRYQQGTNRRPHLAIRWHRWQRTNCMETQDKAPIQRKTKDSVLESWAIVHEAVQRSRMLLWKGLPRA